MAAVADLTAQVLPFPAVRPALQVTFSKCFSMGIVQVENKHERDESKSVFHLDTNYKRDVKICNVKIPSAQLAKYPLVIVRNDEELAVFFF